MAEENGMNNSYKSQEQENGTHPSTAYESSSETEIKIIVSNIENLEKKSSLYVTIVVEHNDIILGTSSSIKVASDRKDNVCEIEYSVSLPVNINDLDSINEIVSTPVLIKVFESSSEGKNLSQDNSQNNLVATENYNGNEKNKSKIKSNLKKMIGMCNLDIYPVLLGEKLMKEKLILEAPTFAWTSIAVSWPNLPVLSVDVIQKGSHIILQDMNINFLNITIESIYNPLTTFTDSLEYKCGTVIYNKTEIPQKVIFHNGKYANFREVDGIKSWNTLSRLENRARFSKYKINSDYENVHNLFKEKINLEKMVNLDIPRISWNSIDRSVLLRSGVRAMQQHIEKYKYWPFQIFIHEKSAEIGKAKSKEPSNARIFQCYVDVTQLLFPGKTRVRTLAQLYTYNASDMKQKTGLNKDIFEMELLKEPEKEKKKKYIVRPNSSVTHYSESPDSDLLPSSPVINEKGDPVIILIEFELYQPIKKARSMDDWSDLIEKLVKRPQSLQPYILTRDVAEEQFYDCVRKLIHRISECYQDFVESNKKNLNKNDQKTNQKTDLVKESKERNSNKEYNAPQNLSTFDCQYEYIPDELQCFIQHLHTAGEYVNIRNTLKNKIITLLDQEFKTDMYSWDSKESQNYVAKAYVCLIEHLHVVLNETSENHYNKTFEQDSKNLYLYAEEAYNYGDTEDANQFYTTIIADNQNNPNAWINYAIFLMKISDTERAIECCREAIILEKRNKLALLFYGVILSMLNEYKEGQIFLEALTTFYPRFVEGWVVLHLFYDRIHYYPGLDISIQTAEKCLKDKKRDMTRLPDVIDEPLAWSTNFAVKNNVFILTAILLMKLNLYEFAGLALAQELSLNGKSTQFLYYLSVHHYLQGQYENAITHLKEAESKYGLDYSLSALMGHCYFKFGNFDDALYYYDYANATFNRPEDIHLVHLRMGTCYINNEKYDAAKKIFFTVCQTSPTSKTWLGLGIALYNMDQLKDAEMAFSEANQINSQDAVVWGYLCLLNITLQRYNEFSQCYRQAVVYNLKDCKLWLAIRNAMKNEDYSPPIITINEEKITSEEPVSFDGSCT